MKRPVIALAVVYLVGIGLGMLFPAEVFSTSSAKQPVETIYLVNRAGRFISDSEIRKDIPAWEQAANKDFASVWGTPQVSLKLVKVAPRGSVSALFVKNGPINGALAYHEVRDGTPHMVIYAGVADFYGFSNSVSFTHELFELLADPSISITNQGYPYPQVCLIGGSGTCTTMFAGTIWANEVCDPVESYVYDINGTPISDFVTQNWFNDEVNGPVDFMNKLSTPFLIGKGGYAQFWDGSGWQQVVNFRHAGRDADGFLKGEKLASR